MDRTCELGEASEILAPEPLTRKKVLRDIAHTVIGRYPCELYPAHRKLITILADAVMALGFAVQRPRSADQLRIALCVKPQHLMAFGLVSVDRQTECVKRDALKAALIVLADMVDD